MPFPLPAARIHGKLGHASPTCLGSCLFYRSFQLICLQHKAEKRGLDQPCDPSAKLAARAGPGGGSRACYTLVITLSRDQAFRPSDRPSILVRAEYSAWRERDARQGRRP